MSKYDAIIIMKNPDLKKKSELLQIFSWYKNK